MNPWLKLYRAVMAVGANRLSQGRAAELLGVTREHLNRVLNGKRESRRLIHAHRQLVGGAK